jgi:hypothetical protein
MTESLALLIEAARKAAPNQSDRAREQQRRSFAYGNTAIENSRITPEMVDRQAEKLAREADDRKR